MTRLSAAVIGLGQAGSRFDEEPRRSIWSHVGAYLALSDVYELVGGADGHEDQRQCFSRRCPGLPAFADGAKLMAATKPDVVSICTPHRGRADLVASLLKAHRPRVLICEKPLETDRASRQRLAALCRDADVPLLVHYNRRYQTAFHKARLAIETERLGRLTSITIAAPNRLFSIGSHAFNTLLYLAREEPEAWTALGLPALDEGGEAAADLLCRFPSGLTGRVVTTGFKQHLVFEIDILGTAGRLRILDNGKRTLFNPFIDSSEFAGYKVLGDDEILHLADPSESSFLAVACEAEGLATGRLKATASSALEALASESLLDDVIAIAKQETKPS